MPEPTDPDLRAALHRLAGRRFTTTVTAQDEPMAGHLVHDTPVLPGVFHLDLVLRLAMAAGIDPATVELRRCLFIAPVVAVGSRDRQLQITVGQPTGRGTLPVTVASRVIENGVVADETWETNFQAEIALGPEWRPSAVDTAGLVARAEESTEAEYLYAFARQLFIQHKGFMKVGGTLWRGADFSLADVRLADEAQVYLDHFHAHPVVLDFAVLVPFLQFDAAVRDSVDVPYIPIYVESFRARRGPGAACMVYVPQLAQRTVTADTETVTADIFICDPDGTVLATLTGYRAKRVRSADHIQRLAVIDPRPEPAAVLVDTVDTPAPAASNGHGRGLEDLVAGLVGAALDRPTGAVDPDRGFYELGLTSVNLLTIAGNLERELGRELYPTLLFEHPTVRSLAGHLREAGLAPSEPAPPATAVPRPAPEPAEPPRGLPGGPIAIIGLAGRYPNAGNIGEFWDILRTGRDCVTEIPPDRWRYERYFHPDRNTPGKCYSKWGAFLDGIEDFDPLLFNISPRQAELTDPHERLFLQTAWEALEDSGYTPERLSEQVSGAVGVFAGVMWGDYQLYGLEEVLKGNPEIPQSWIGSVPNRVSYAFDFHGPSLAVDTACSSSLVALHLACESVRRGECQVALAGGVNLSLHPYKYLRSAAHQLLSTDGRCRVFGRDADGYVPGEGTGAVLVRPLADAITAGDQIYGVIRGSALHHSGRTSGYAVPSPEAQNRVIADALAKAAVPVESITLIEAHGAGTTLGDQVEIAALTKAFRRYTDQRGFCAIGSVKTNIGHPEAAAGVAALSKILLCLRHRTIVPSLHSGDLNRGIAFEETPFRVADRTEPWRQVIDPETGEPMPRRAALSAFGFGGANVHMIVEEYVPPQPATPRPRSGGAEIVPLSAADDDRLRALAVRLRDHVRSTEGIELADLAHTMQVGRRAMESRLAVTVRDTAELAGVLDDFVAGRPLRVPSSTGRVKHSRPVAVSANGSAPDDPGAAWTRGQDVRWPETGRRISLPTYPFHRVRCWIATAPGVPQVTTPQSLPPAPDLRAGTMFYEPVWAPAPGRPGGPADGPLLVFDSDPDRVAELRRRARVIWVRPGHAFSSLGSDEFTVSPGAADDSRALFAALRADGTTPAAVLHLWSLGTPSAPEEPVRSVFEVARHLAVGRSVPMPLVFAYHAPVESPAHAAVGGLARSVRREQPNLAVQTVHFTYQPTDVARLCDVLLGELAATDDIEVRHTAEGRRVLGFSWVRPADNGGPPLARAGGVYVISGGMGGIALHVARRMASQARVGLMLFGRSATPDQAVLSELTALGATVRYLQGDVSDPGDVRRVITTATAELGPVTGVVHAAGVVEDGLLLNKAPDSVARVLAPKLAGAANLDAATRTSPLDYLLLFSSTAAVLGSVGTTDYAAANRYLDSFAAWRNDLRDNGERTGHTVSMNWPLWAEGGMRINPAVEDQVLATTGLRPLPTDAALDGLDAALSHGGGQLAVMVGDRERVETRMTIAPVLPAVPPVAGGEVERELVAIFAEVLKLPPAELDVEDDLADYGVDSIAAMSAVSKMEQRFGTPLVPSIVARLRTLRALAGHLAGELTPTVTSTVTPTVTPVTVHSGARGSGRIAVISVAARLPGAVRVEDFWDNLVHGRESVGTAPADRFGPEWTGHLPAGTLHGGFIDGVDMFDAGFFGISDEDARWMEPQQRLCLELAHELVERAGYRRAELAGGRAGVFLGVATNGYVKDGLLAGAPTTARLLVGGLPNMVPATISQHLDLRGPSVVVDTACSSSLVAIHRAVRSLLDGECDSAIAGGCELLLDPFVYIGLAQAGILSADGHTSVFDAGAGGIVPGEGAGLVLLKREEDALADGDRILATILGSATNNDGRTMGLTAPSHEAQAAVIREAISDAGVAAGTIGYLEAHGSASGFGDPIEIHAAAEAYGDGSPRTQPCTVGSVKSNVGALLHAGGVASFIKVVLALRHEYLPPTINCRQPHARLKFEQTPFRPALAGGAWPSGHAAGSPRRAGVSAFGFGGTNCHVVLEEAPRHEPVRDPLPLTEFDRRQVWLPTARTTPATPAPVLTADALVQHIESRVAGLAGAPAGDPDRTFMELGLGSAALVQLNDLLEQDLRITVQPTVFFRHPTVRRLAEHLVTEHPDARLPGSGPVAVVTQRTPAGSACHDIAIIGIAGRFPGAANVDEFWARLAAGDDLVGPVPPSRWDHRAWYDPEGLRPGSTDCGAGGFLDDVDAFDAGFFRVLPAEADVMDPQSRLLLETMYAAAEDGGVITTLRGSRTGVYVGQCFRDYDGEMIAREHPIGAYDATGIAVTMAANRVSFQLDLAGPSMTVDTACSSSLYALSLAVDALRRGEVDMAFAGGSNLILSPRHYLQLSAIGALSARGRCRAFEAGADGYVPAEAVAAVLLKPLDKALRDGDPVHAVIRGVATNHGGHANSLTAPNPGRQADLLTAAWQDAGIDPRTIGYLEAHGSGTQLGDPIEVEAAKAAFASGGGGERFCALGTAKAHMGHSEAAAGIVGVIKTVLSMRHGVIPAMPGFTEPNSYCRLDEGPLFVNTEPIEWHAPAGQPRRAGVSSFGFGGANAHVVLEEPAPRPAGAVPGRAFVLPFSARDNERLRTLVRRHRDFLAAGHRPPMASIEQTLRHGREQMPERIEVVARTHEELRAQLDRYLAGDPITTPPPGAPVAEAGAAVRVSLPTYPFERQRFWLDGGQADAPAEAAAAEVRQYLSGSGYGGRHIADGVRRFGSLAAQFAARILRGRDPLTVTAGYERLAAAVADITRGAEPAEVDADLAALTQHHPELRVHVELLRNCLPALPDVLEGRKDALGVYFSGDRADLLPRIYRGNAVADHFNELVARAAESFARAAGRPVRILEVGAGTGGTTERVLDLLAPLGDAVEYTYTDISPSFFREAEREFGGRVPRLRFAVLDLEHDPAAQGFEPGAYDVIIASNVVHATRRIADSLARIRGLLADGGILVLNEVTNNLDYLALLFGMIPSWWSLTDEAERLPGSPLLDVGRWQRALTTAGFDTVWPFGAPDLPVSEADQAVLLCRAGGTVPAAPVSPAAEVRAAPARPAADSGGLRGHLRQVFADFLRVSADDIDERSTFERYGLDSLGAIQIVRILEQDFGKLPKVLLYECPTIDALADDLMARNPDACAAVAGPVPTPAVAVVPEAAPATPPGDPVAIVGMAGILPGSPDLRALWRNLRDGTDLVTEVPADRFDWRPLYGDPVRDEGKTNSKWGAFIDGHDRFDAAFFGLSPLEAELTDPQQRLFTQAAWHAVEDAGHRPGELRGSRTGVFVGVTSHDYVLHLIRAGRQMEAHAINGNARCVIANRVSYQLGLHGPSEVVDTACSSSLTALHRAVQAIRSGECEGAVVGGVHLMLTHDLFVAFGQMGMLSDDGRCMTFDKRANGFTRGEGVIALYLKPLSRALADGDTVHAVIRGTGAGHGGQVQSLPVPNPAAQAELIASVIRDAGVDPATITYIETHGTGTEVGDPIEIRGLRRAFAALPGGQADGRAWCGLGAVKSNMGHLEAAAGLAGVVKTVLALRHATLPPSLHFQEVNPLLDLDGSPFYIVDSRRPWPATTGGPRRAGVSSFGFGGANVHVLLEEYEQAPATPANGTQPVVLSARSEDRLRAYARALLDRLGDQEPGERSLQLADIAHTLRVGRDEMAVRLAVLAEDTAQLADRLRAYLAGDRSGTLTGTVRSGGRPPVTVPETDPARWASRWVTGEAQPWPEPAGRRRLSLPGYPFAPDRHWAEPVPGRNGNGNGKHPGNATNGETTVSWQDLVISLHDGNRS
jgi:acyl transferase domain-containing protein/acyl carrier protein